MNPLLRAAAVLAALSVMGGCELFSMTLDALPRGDVPAVFEPADRPTAVLVDDPAHRLPSDRLKSRIAHRVGKDLQESETITEFTPTRLIDEMRMSNEGFGSWSIARVGRRAGAGQVIHVLIDRFELEVAAGVYRPAALVRVKVIDTAGGERLFPAGGESGHAVTSRLFFQNHTHDDDRSTGRALGRKLADRIGEDVAKLFHKHKPRPVGSGFPE